MKLFKISLALQMAIATVLGILCGLFFGDLNEVFSPYADAYIMILKITALPYLIIALMHGVGQLTGDQARQVLKKGVMFIALAWSINLVMIYVLYYLLPQPALTQIGGYISTETPRINFADLLIPDNIFYDLANNIVPAIVLFSLLVGIALLSIKEKTVIMQGLGNLLSALTQATAWIARITPIGTFLIIANQAGTIQLNTIKQVSTYIILYILIASLIVFWIFPKLTSMITTISSYQWLKQLLPILVLAYTTNVVIVCLPYIIEVLKKETQQIAANDQKAQMQIQGTVSVVFNLPLGSLFIMAFVLFSSVCYGATFTWMMQLRLFVTTCLNGLGAVGLGSWINSLTFTLDSFGLPFEALNLFLTTLPFTAGFQSMISVMEIASISLFITLACSKKLTLLFRKFAQQGLLTITPLLLLFTCIKIFNPLPEIKNETKSIYELSISSTIPLTILQEAVAIEQPDEEPLARILRDKKLRVGYNTQVAPFCFLNNDEHIVGYDIAFAYELAYDLGCSLELVPLNYSDLSEQLLRGEYDIAMSAISMNESRLKSMTFSTPYLYPRFCLVTHAQNKQLFSSIEQIDREPRVKLAVLKGSAFETTGKELFPHIPLLLLDSYADFNFEDPFIALLWEEQEAIAWSLKNRNFRVIFPQPPLGVDILSYAIHPEGARFKNYLDEWLKLKQSQGFTEKQYDLWIKGKTEIAAPTKARWSIIHNVLHWVD